MIMGAAAPIVDLSSIISPIITVMVLVGIIRILTELFRPKVKGAIGEGFVNLAAKIHLDSQEYHLIKNVTVPTTMGTSQ
ncbi:MAG: hypothetical protein HN341_03075, partial [Verrucomicrobia bacterium]|nr:hypothetical protein [Verrucomicrobiota bacterium]